MSGRSDAFEAFAEATEPRDEVVARVRDRLLCEVTGDAGARALLRHLPASVAVAESRVRRRLLASPSPPSRPWRLLWAAAALLLLGGGTATGGMALAAAALAVVVLWPASEPPTPIALESEHTWSETELGQSVRARYRGSGDVEPGSPLRVTWRSGTIELDVEPERNVELSVRTREAVVRVTGTLLTVTRDALGTHVEVDHGQVEVQCSGGVASDVGASQQQLCTPTTAAGLLGRARALEEHGADSAGVLAAIAEGLEVADGPIEGELRAFRIGHLLRIGEHAAAFAHVEAYLSEGTALRREQMLRVAAQLALSLHGCERALPFLEELVRDGGLDQDQHMYAACRPEATAVGSPHAEEM